MKQVALVFSGFRRQGADLGQKTLRGGRGQTLQPVQGSTGQIALPPQNVSIAQIQQQENNEKVATEISLKKHLKNSQTCLRNKSLKICHRKR